MKLSFAVSVSEEDKDYQEFARKLEILNLLGYDGVELAVQDPTKVNAGKIKELVGNYNLEVSAIATGSAFTKERLSLSSPFEFRREAAIQRLKDQISFAAIFSSKTKVIVGLIRGNAGNLSNANVGKEYFAEGIRECDDFARTRGITLVVEAINRYEIDFLNTLKETDCFLKNYDLFSVKILSDTFHMNIEERSIPESIEKFKSQLGYVHIADSNRMAPGQGHLDFAEIIKTLKEIGYNGWISAEIVSPGSGFGIAARYAIWHLRNLGV